MKRVLFDVNVVLDVLLNRYPHAEASASVWALVETGTAEGLLAAHALTTIHYLVRKDVGAVKAKATISMLLRAFGVAPVNAVALRDALELPSADFDDAVTAAAARAAKCDYIVTRDPRGFRGSHVRPLTPEAITTLLGAS